MLDTPFRLHEGTANTMLIIDDDELNRDILANIFEAEHPILNAENGQEGLELLLAQREEICAILLDVVMPVMDGMSMLEQISALNIPREIPVFLITGETGGEILRRAYDLGVMDVINKPFEPHIVERRVNSVMELYAARNHFQEVVAQQTRDLREQNEQLSRLNMGIIEALATATEFRSEESGEHVRRIHDITLFFLSATPLAENYSEEDRRQISLAAILHDVGKISIPDAILNKPGKLTSEEFAAMQEHTVRGELLLNQIRQLHDLPFYEHAKSIVRHHHERWDGRGYPDKLCGDAIPLPAQIVSIADVYDALVSTRVYKPPFSHERAVEMITKGECGTFNPLLLEYFLRIAPLIEELYKAAPGEGENGEREKNPA